MNSPDQTPPARIDDVAPRIRTMLVVLQETTRVLSLPMALA